VDIAAIAELDGQITAKFGDLCASASMQGIVFEHMVDGSRFGVRHYHFWTDQSPRTFFAGRAKALQAIADGIRCWAGSKASTL